ncbi:hypothetical protein BGW39_002285 [Mortierella sp. 14UC]|nr:hypothetical protein BGW39_002285 [Mortierella sp. 14UC]
MAELEVLATTIQSLTGLRRLDLGLYTFSAREGRPIGSYLLRYCPPSLELLRVDVGDVQLSLMEEYGFDSDSEDDSNGDSEDGDESESEEEEGGEVLGDDESVTGESEDPEMDGEVYVSNINHLHVEAAVERRTAPLVHLKAFWCWDLLGHSEKEVREIFETCPNIEQLHLPNLSSRLDVDTTMIARAIVESCPKVNTLQFYGQGSDTKIELPFKVLELLPEQQVQQACIRNFHIELDEQMARGVFLRHSTTLHTLILQGCSPTDSAAIRVILAECGALEDLRFIHTNHKDYEAIWPYPDLYGKGCGILLADAVAAPWACTKLKRLELLVRINELCAEPGLVRVAYFRREAPVELTPTETRFFESLERLYRQIGSLVELQHLDLQLDLMSSDGGRHEDIPTSSEVSFPGMLNLDMGRPGYLELLGGLKKLRELRGSVRADTYETTLRMGALEAYWMRDHWPELELAEFFFKGSDITQPFRWLQEQQRQRGRNLKLVVPYSLYEDCVERVWAFPPK